MEQQLKPEEREEFLRRIARSASFQRLFRGEDGELFLNEWKLQLRGFDPDPYIHAYNAGLRYFYDFTQTVINQDVEKERAKFEAQTKKE